MSKNAKKEKTKDEHKIPLHSRVARKEGINRLKREWEEWTSGPANRFKKRMAERICAYPNGL